MGRAERVDAGRAAGRAGRGRLAPAGGGLRAVQQQVLRSFAATGRPPPGSALAGIAARYGTTAEAVLAKLHAADFVQLGPGGDIHAAYPFSAVPTSHVVRITDGPRVHAMCAIDALGMAAMLGADVRIISTDPCTGEPVTITVQADGKTAAWQPPAAVVFSGQHASCGSPGAHPGTPATAPAAKVSCRYRNFFAAPASAAAWASVHPEVTGQALDQTAALRLGVSIFGHLLTDPC